MSNWRDRYNDLANHGSDDLQRNVQRTKGGERIDDATWTRTVDDIVKLCNISENSVVIEVCCGNGMLLGPIAQQCKRAIGVDFSVPLLEQLNAQFKGQVETHLQDALEFEWEKNSVDVVMIYFSIQLFSERDALRLMQRAFSWIRNGGTLFIGDVPDEEKKWAYLSKPEYRRDYLARVLSDTPMIGQWFNKEFFRALPDLMPEMEVTVVDQPSYHINSEIRYDVVIKKKDAK